MNFGFVLCFFGLFFGVQPYFLSQSWHYTGNSSYSGKIPGNSNRILDKFSNEIPADNKTARQCTRRGYGGVCQTACGEEGKGYGSCEDRKTCCLYISSCNGESRQQISYFQSPSFPQFDSNPDVCNMKIKLLPGTCAVRFDFVRFSLAVRNSASLQCKVDSFNLIAEGSNSLCGVLDGYAVTVPVQKTQQFQKLSVITRSSKYQWNIKITQIPCNVISNLPEYKKCGIRRQTPLPPPETQGPDSISVENPQLEGVSRLRSAFVTRDEVGPNQFLNRIYARLADGRTDPMAKLERIYFGKEAVQGEFPWQVLLQWNQSVVCGGTLISDQYVITAAHCVLLSPSKSMVPELSVRLGEQNFNEYPNAYRQVIKVRRVHLHHAYDRQELSGDIAVLELATPALLGIAVYPICMPAKGNLYSEVDGLISGFGRIEGDRRTSILHWANVVLWSNKRCSKAWSDSKGALQLFDSQICALGVVSQDSCQGDSGGPLVVQSSSGSGQYELVGITSFGDSCGTPNVPGVYTRLTYFLQWVGLVLSNI